MKRLLTIIAITIVLILGLWLFFLCYLNSGSTEPDNTVWESYIGRDTTVGILPDAYANYFTYTLARTKNNIGFRIKGEFPDTRYFSFNVYSLGDNATQGSLVDYQIITDSGKPNPFLVNRDSSEFGKSFTVNIIPQNFANINLPNKLPFRDDVKLLAMVIRLYDYNKDDFGGVEFPTVEAFEIEEDESSETHFEATNLPRPLNLRWIVRRRSLPGMIDRLSQIYETENTAPLDIRGSADNLVRIPFHAVDSRGYIENNDNRYLLAGITKKEDEIYYFKFKAPTYTTGHTDINQTEVRYWSFNLGNSNTYNFNALKDEDSILDENGFVHIVLAEKDAELEAKIAELGYNFLEWNMPWQKGIILFRHMLANPLFEAQIDDVPPMLDDTEDYESIEAQNYLGAYAPQGLKMTKQVFLDGYR